MNTKLLSKLQLLNFVSVRKPNVYTYGDTLFFKSEKGDNVDIILEKVAML